MNYITIPTFFSYVFILFLLAFPLAVVHLEIPYELIDLGRLFPLPILMLSGIYILDKIYNSAFDLFKAQDNSKLPVQNKYMVREEFSYILKQPQYIIFIIASWVFFFYTTIFKTEYLNSIIGSIGHLCVLLLILLSLIYVKQKFKTYKAAYYLFNIQLLLFFIPFMLKSSLAWHLYIGNILTYNLFFTG